jgi:hypothetical protein
LAKWLANRVRQSYFETGIVATSENLGTQAAPPSHREMLDWPVVESIERCWSLKRPHRAIVLSAATRRAEAQPSTVCSP